MLKRLVLKDFQKHDRLAIDLDPLTVIHGDSEAGKSAVVRALTWVVFNQSTGTDVRVGADGCQVKATFDEGEVSRVRGPGNYYLCQGKRFNFDTVSPKGVPEPVQQLVGLGRVNFQSQHDPLYWFSDTAGQVSKQLNQIISLDIIDQSLDAANREVRKAKAEADVAAERLSECEREVEALSWVPQFEKELAKLQEIHDKASQIALNRIRLGQLLGAIETLREQLEREEGAFNAILGVLKLASRVRSLTQRREDLGSLLGKIERAREQTRGGRPDFKPVIDLRKEADNIAERRRALEHLLNQIKEARDSERVARREREEAEGELRRASQGVCPVCRQKLPSQSSHPTCTSRTKRRLRDPENLPGMEPS